MKKISLTQPPSPKLGRKTIPGMVQDTGSRPPRRPSVKILPSSKDVTEKRTVRAVLQSWASGRVGKRRRKAWKMAGYCLMWLVWLECNRQVFLGEGVDWG
ncbi:hypothetical protein CsSME_00036777 [Camellia sinensis var. sinensis]